jgi:hypothetical protein
MSHSALNSSQQKQDFSDIEVITPQCPANG